MIWYRHHTGTQTCVGGVISQSSSQFMCPSGEKIAQGCYLPSSSPKNIPLAPLLSISIQSPSSESFFKGFPFTENLVSSHSPVINKRTTNHPQSNPQVQSQLDTSDEESPSETLAVAYHDDKNITGKNNKLNNQDCIETFRSSNLSKRLECMLSGTRIMNEVQEPCCLTAMKGEEKDFWDKEKANNDNSRPGSVPGDEAGSACSSGSLHASDTSEDSHGNHGSCTKKDQCTSGGEQSTFLFLGPVGKKRKYCRDRQKSGDMEQESPSPLSLPPPTPMEGDSDKDISSVEGAGTPELDEGLGHSNSKSIYRSGRDESYSSSTATITSTPTPVIRSVPSRQREEQPLNLSLPSPSEPQTHSPGRRNESVHVSVISLVPREREEEENNDSSFQDISSPSLSFYSSRSPRESCGELTPGGALLSPVPSTSRGFHSSISLSRGDSSNTSVPSTFQGLLVAHGIISPNSGRSTLKKKLQCRDCGKEFSQLRNYRYHRSRHEGTQQFACTCPVCGKTFNDKGYLSSHLKIHRNAKEYKCEWCEKSFNQRVAYNMHVRIHTGHKPHKCPICPKAFSRKMLLRQHLRTHTGERPYKCEICSKAFADRSNMLLHQRLHSGQRPYKCDICQKSFSKNHHLKTHLNHHAGIKPYQCSKCKSCFSQSSNMKTHFRKCSGIASVTSTVTSVSSHRIQDMPGSSATTSLASPPSMSRYNTNPEEIDEQELHHHHQQLLQAQQTHLQQLASSQQQLQEQHQQQILRSGHQSSVSALGQAAAVQALGLNLGILGLATAGGRSRRTTGNVGVNLLPLGSPSPTSLAAGHPFIPLATVESAASTGTSSPASSIPTSSVILLSPRHHSNISEASTGLHHHSSLPHSSHHHHQQQQQRSLISSRSRQPHQQQLQQLQQQQQHQQYISQQMHTDIIHENRVHQLPSPQLMISPRPSPQQRHNNPSYRTSPDPYEILLPALQVSRPIPQTSQQQFQQEHFAQIRPHGLQYQRAGGGGVNGSNRQQGNLLTMTRPLSLGSSNISQVGEGFSDSSSSLSLQFAEQDLSLSPQSSWRHQENNDVKQNFKDGQFRSSNS